MQCCSSQYALVYFCSTTALRGWYCCTAGREWQQYTTSAVISQNCSACVIDLVDQGRAFNFTKEIVGNYNAELVAGDECKVNKSRINFQIQLTLTPDEVMCPLLSLSAIPLYLTSLCSLSLFTSDPAPPHNTLSLPLPQRWELKLDWVKTKWLKSIVVIISGHHNYTYPYGVPLFHSTFFSWSCLLLKVLWYPSLFLLPSSSLHLCWNALKYIVAPQH